MWVEICRALRLLMLDSSLNNKLLCVNMYVGALTKRADLKMLLIFQKISP